MAFGTIDFDITNYMYFCMKSLKLEDSVACLLKETVSKSVVKRDNPVSLGICV
jgi:hypothetical protein